MMAQSAPHEHDLPRGWRLWARVASRIAILVSIIAAILFGAAGCLDWWAAWLVIVLYTVFLAVFIVWGLSRSPELIRERSQVAPNVKVWDKVINALYAVLLLALGVVAGLDMRYGWSTVPAPVMALGFVGIFAGGYTIWRTLAENPFASRFARIQDERGQAVISSGPYRIVRHPMYGGIILLILCLPLSLGSWWALVPGVLISTLYVLRTALEDRMLIDELPGYVEYAGRTRYRLFPGIW